MKGGAPQTPVTQKVQLEVKDVPQTPQQPAVPQTPSPTVSGVGGSPSPTKPNKNSKAVIFTILIIALVGLTIAGFLVYKYFSPSETSTPWTKKTEEEVEIYKGIWDPVIGLEEENYLTSNPQKLKDLGINTIFISALPPIGEPEYERLEEIFSPELVERVKEVIPNEKELLIDTIQTAHRNGFKVALTVGDPPVKENVDMEALNLRIVEVAKIAEEYDVELFAPLNEPEMIFSGTRKVGPWRQEILPKIKKVYHGDITWNGAFPGFPDKESISKTAKQPPGDYAGYDYIGFGTMLMSTQTLDEFAEKVEGAMDFSLAKTERDGCKGIIITEFGVLMSGPWSQEEVARAYEIVLEKGKERGVYGYFAFRLDFLETNLPGLVSKENLKTQEVLRKWFTEIL